jgi:hypothetical protein
MFSLLAGTGQWTLTTVRRFRQQAILSSGDEEPYRMIWNAVRQAASRKWNACWFYLGEHFSWLPIRKMTPEEYYLHLHEQLCLVEAEIKDLERELGITK